MVLLMKVQVWTLTTEQDDRIETTVHNTLEEVFKHLRCEFQAGIPVWEGHFEQEELDGMSDDEFRETLNDYEVTSVIDEHTMEV